MYSLKIQAELEIEIEFQLWWNIQERIKIIKEILDDKYNISM